MDLSAAVLHSGSPKKQQYMLLQQGHHHHHLQLPPQEGLVVFCEM
jgi:hypothetical protein